MKQGNQGQVIVEYILTLLMALTVISLVMTAFNASLRNAWREIVMDIAKACPSRDCPNP